MNIKDFLIQNKIKYKNINLYEKALIHKSFSNENDKKINYQRLEFLGDSILDFIISNFLFLKFPNKNEGEMSIIRADMVKGENLSKITLKIGLDKYIKLRNFENNLNKNSKIYADVFESFIAAIYLDLGLEESSKFIQKHILNNVNNLNADEHKNPKTILQEYLQLESRKNIIYKTRKDKKGFFISEIFHDKNKFGLGKGKTKKESEVEAAKNALKIVKIKRGSNEQ